MPVGINARPNGLFIVPNSVEKISKAEVILPKASFLVS